MDKDAVDSLLMKATAIADSRKMERDEMLDYRATHLRSLERISNGLDRIADLLIEINVKTARPIQMEIEVK